MHQRRCDVMTLHCRCIDVGTSLLGRYVSAGTDLTKYRDALSTIPATSVTIKIFSTGPRAARSHYYVVTFLCAKCEIKNEMVCSYWYITP